MASVQLCISFRKIGCLLETEGSSCRKSRAKCVYLSNTGVLFSDYFRCMWETMSLKLCVDTEPGSVASIA